MTDVNEQDADEDDLKTIQYNKAIAEVEPLVVEDYYVFNNVIRDEDPDMYEEIDENKLKFMHQNFIQGYHMKLPKIIYGYLFGKWLEAVHQESERRVIG